MAHRPLSWILTCRSKFHLSASLSRQFSSFPLSPSLAHTILKSHLHLSAQPLGVWQFFCLFVLFFGDRVSLCSSGCPGTHSVDQAGLELRNLPAPASQVLGLRMCTTTARCKSLFKVCIYTGCPCFPSSGMPPTSFEGSLSLTGLELTSLTRMPGQKLESSRESLVPIARESDSGSVVARSRSPSASTALQP